MKVPEKKVAGKTTFAGLEICGADIPKCDGTDRAVAVTDPDPVAVAQKAICTGSDDYNWHELFGAPPIKMFPPQEMKFTDACAEDRDHRQATQGRLRAQ